MNIFNNTGALHLRLLTTSSFETLKLQELEGFICVNNMSSSSQVPNFTGETNFTRL